MGDEFSGFDRLPDAACGQASEPWDDADLMRVMAAGLLLNLRDQGPMSDDHIARYCVRRDELASLMRDIDKLALSLATVDALAEFLDEAASGAQALGAAIKDWRKHASIVRWSFKWDKLPPTVQKKAQRRRAVLVSHAERNGWIARDPADGLWCITGAGRAAINASGDSGPDSSEDAVNKPPPTA